MSEAVLRVSTSGGAEVEALLARIERAAAAAQGRTERASRASRQRQTRDTQQATEEQVGHYRAAAAAIARDDQLATRSKLRELALQGDAQKRFSALYADAHRKATAALETEIGHRGQLTDREKRQVEQLALAMVDEHDRAERSRTASTRRETRERESAERATVTRITAGLRGAAAAAAQLADAAHSAIQAGREDLAGANRTLGNAVRNSGGNETDVIAAKTAVERFAVETGMRYEDVTAALETGQARGSALEAQPGQTRAQAMESALTTIREANAEDVAPGQLLAARGRLGQAGLSGDALTTALRYTVRAAQRGSVEVDQIISQGLPGAVSLMTQRAAALGPGATEAQRQTARLDAFRESVALQEVAASAGKQPGNTANTLAGLNNFVRTPRRQEMILQNIRSAEAQINTSTPEGRERARRLHELYNGDNAIFERDPTRRGHAMRMRDDVDPMELAVRMTAAAGGNASGAMNLLAGGGQGNPQSLLNNQRSLLTFIGSELGRVRELQNGGGITDAQLAEHQRAVESDDLSTLNRSREQGRQSARRPGALQRGSDLVADRERLHPLFYGAVRSIPVAGPLAIAGAGALFGEFGGAPASAGSSAVPVSAGGTAAAGSQAQSATIRDAVRDGVVAGLRNQPVVAQVSQQDAVHAAMLGSPRRAGEM